MLRRNNLFSIALAVVMLAGIIFAIPVLAATGDDFEVRILGRQDTIVQHQGRNTYTVEFQLRTQNDAIFGQLYACNLAYDTEIFELVNWVDGSRVLSDAPANITLIPGATHFMIPNNRGFSSTYYTSDWSIALQAALSADSTIGYLLLQAYTTEAPDPNPLYDYRESFSDYTALHKIRLAFKSGKSLSDITENSIRLVSISEMSGLGAVTDKVYLHDGDAEYIYGDRTGKPDTLSKPVIDLEPIGEIVEEPTTTFVIAVTSGGNGTVTGGGTVNSGSSVTITAIPSTGYMFDGWYENNLKIPGANAVYTFTADANRTLEARFIEPAAPVDALHDHNNCCIDYSKDDDVIVESISSADYTINLTRETFEYLGVDAFASVTAYKINDKIGKKPFNSAELLKLLKKDLKLELTINGETITFPAIKGRPKVPKGLSANYRIAETGGYCGQWVLAAKGGSTPRKDIEIAVAAVSGGKASKLPDANGWGKFYAGDDNGICVKVIPDGNQVKVQKTVYYYRETPKKNTDGTYTAAGKQKKISATSQQKNPKYSIKIKAEKKNKDGSIKSPASAVIKVKPETYVSINGAPPVLYTVKTDVDVLGVTGKIELWQRATANGKKSETGKQVLTR